METLIGEDYTISDGIRDTTFSLADTNYIATWNLLSY